MSLTVREAEDILRERYDFFVTHYNAGDISKVVTGYYTESAYVTGHETPMIQGYQSLKALFEGLKAEFGSMRVELIDTRVASDDCIYSLVAATNQLVSSGEEAVVKSLLVFRKQDGEWRCDADIFAMGGF